MSLQAAIDKWVKELEVYRDSALLIYPLRGEWNIREPRLILYHKYITDIIKQLNEINFNHLPREENQMADALATLVAMLQVNSSDAVQPIRKKLNEIPAHYAQIEDEMDGKPWYYDIQCYIKNQQYPEHMSENDKRILRRLSANFLLDGEILYKKGKDQILFRCVDAPEARRIIAEVHEGICGMHANGHKMSREIMKARYYWLTLEKDCI